MADWSDACEVARGLIEHEHKNSVVVERSYWREAVKWICLACDEEGFVEGIAIQAAKAAEARECSEAAKLVGAACPLCGNGASDG